MRKLRLRHMRTFLSEEGRAGTGAAVPCTSLDRALLRDYSQDSAFLGSIQPLLQVCSSRDCPWLSTLPWLCRGPSGKSLGADLHTVPVPWAHCLLLTPSEVGSGAVRPRGELRVVSSSYQDSEKPCHILRGQPCTVPSFWATPNICYLYSPQYLWFSALSLL
jgi:hypothetical protein